MVTSVFSLHSTVDGQEKVFSDFCECAPMLVRSELWHGMFNTQGKKRVHYMCLPYDKATLIVDLGEGSRATLAKGESDGCEHPQNSPVTLRAKIGKPAPFLYFCSFFQLIRSCPLGVSPPPKVSFSTQLALSIKRTHPCSAITLLPLYLPGELTSHTVQWPQLLNYTACHCLLCHTSNRCHYHDRQIVIIHSQHPQP